MELSGLLETLSDRESCRFSELDIKGICYDSRRAQPGYLFVALPGFHVDGHDFISDAVARGAITVVAERRWFEEHKDSDIAVKSSLPLIVVNDSRRAIAELSAAFYGYPGRKLRVIGVTGTDGKTTTMNLINAILEEAGYRTGLLGTVDFKIGERRWENETRLTTPQAPEVQQLLAEMVKERVDYAIIESTSHALALERVRGCEYDAGVFTNLSADHLDFHNTLEEYLRAKARLFEMLDGSFPKGVEKAAILNADDQAFAELRVVSPPKVISYGIENDSMVRGKDIEHSEKGASFTAITPEGGIRFDLKLVGIFNVYNSLAAIATGLSQGIDLATAKRALESVEGVPGRMERIDSGQPFTVIVDYAHTPNGLQRVLELLRPLVKGRLIVVFGCAGERDKGRRWGMGQVAGRYADFSILTNEDPRTENPLSILEEIESSIVTTGRLEGRGYAKIVDRRQAICFALKMAAPADLVLLAGKGHEKSIIIGDELIPWDDRQVAREILQELGA